jgi:GalNAc5-diNAcBac-PP-undecaprenol beta-1,3-glucosyltransferase
MIAATVIIPTHDHGPLLSHSLGSALAQTVKDIEVFVIGDGVPDVTRSLLRQAREEDGRVRFWDHPKGPRLGEIYRHAALAEARGRIVCYLSDDDLWLPDHLETMGRLLEHADWAHSLPVQVLAEGEVGGFYLVNHADSRDRAATLAGHSRVCLSCGAHTLAAYRRLPVGWRTTPAGIFTDLYMWQQFLSDPACRASSGTRPTALKFAGTIRRGWTLERREAELAAWACRIADPAWRAGFVQDVLDQVLEQAWRLHEEAWRLQGSTTLRLRRRAGPLLGLPGLGPLARAVAGAMAGRRE